MKTTILLGIVAVTIFGTLAVQNMIAEAGLDPLERIEVVGNTVTPIINNVPVESVALCPNTHPILIGGSYGVKNPSFPAPQNFLYEIDPVFDVISNSYKVVVTQFTTEVNVEVTAKALCAQINFPMNMMVGGTLLEIDTIAVFVAAIGVNPVITGLVALSIAGVVGQATWFVYKRKNRK